MPAPDEHDADWNRELERAVREFAKVERRGGKRLTDFLVGEWRTAPPLTAGVYFVREPVNGEPHAYAMHFDPGAWSASPIGGSARVREFLYLRGDADGSPTRADDGRVEREAHASGWSQRPG